MPDLNPTTFKPVLLKLVKSPQDFGTADIELALEHVITPGATLPEQVGAFLTGLAVARVELRKEIVIAAAAFIYSRSIPVIVFDADRDFIVDIVGTGGDGHNTFNVSTTAAIVAAGAGARVIKVKGIGIVSSLCPHPNAAGCSTEVERQPRAPGQQISYKPSDASLSHRGL
jgi:anthranilate phosphoribosyltransferase